MLSVTRYLLFVCTILFLPSCILTKARPIEATVFLPDGDKLQPMKSRSPFNGTYIPNSHKLEAARITKNSIYFAPVETRFVLEKIRHHRFISDYGKIERSEEAGEVAKYLREKFTQAIRDYPQHPFQVSSFLSKEALILELNLVEVEPTEPITNVVGSILSFVFAGSGLIRVFASGSVAFEGILRDGSTNEILVQFKDREADKTTPFSIKDFSMYAHIRKTIDEWAQQFAELLATNEKHQVEEAWSVSLNPF